MSNTMLVSRMFAGTMEYPASRGAFKNGFGYCLSQQLLATDPVGTTTITLSNVVNGSNIQIETQDGTVTRYSQQYGPGVTLYDAATQYDAATLYDSQASTPIVLDLYQQGSALNDLRIKIRKGSASPYYLPYETQVTATSAPISIYVSQTSDE